MSSKLAPGHKLTIGMGGVHVSITVSCHDEADAVALHRSLVADIEQHGRFILTTRLDEMPVKATEGTPQ